MPMNTQLLFSSRLNNWLRLLCAGCMAAVLFLSLLPARAAAAEAANDFIQRLSTQVLDEIRKNPDWRSGDVTHIMPLVDSLIMPNVNFQRMTALTVGPAWRQATPEQRTALANEYKTLLVRTYSGALSQVSDQTVRMQPFRASATDKDVLVSTRIVGKGDSVQLDYRLEKTDDGNWKIYNLNVLGVWLVETYRSQFSQIINTRGIDGLIQSLKEHNTHNTPLSGGQ